MEKLLCKLMESFLLPEKGIQFRRKINYAEAL